MDLVCTALTLKNPIGKPWLTDHWLLGSVGLEVSQQQLIPECQSVMVNSFVSKASMTFPLNIVVLVMM